MQSEDVIVSSDRDELPFDQLVAAIPDATACSCATVCSCAAALARSRRSGDEAKTAAAVQVDAAAALATPASPGGPVAAAETAEAQASEAAMRRHNKLWARIGYYSSYAGSSGASPLYSVLLTRQGLTATQIGFVVDLNPLSNLFVLPPVAYIADRYACAWVIVIISGVIGPLAYFILTTLSHASLAVVTLLMLVHFVCRVPFGPFYDQHILATLPAERREEWGSMRCFGGYGWGSFAPVVSWMIEAWGWWAAGMMHVIGSLGGLLGYYQVKVDHAPAKTERKFGDVFAFMYSRPRIILFLVAECIMGLGYSLIGTYLFIFLKTLGAPSILLGIAVTTTTVVEIPIFQFSRHLHRRFTDRQLLAFSMLSWMVRVIGYSLLEHPWFVLFFEPLHGLTFGLMWISGIHFISIAFPRTLSHTANGLLSGAAFGLGPIIGNIMGGFMYDGMGPRWMFRSMAFVMGALSVVFYLFDAYLERRGMVIVADDNVTVQETPVIEAPAADAAKQPAQTQSFAKDAKSSSPTTP